MRAAIDLHIHSALSPCSDNEMTPNNIVNMALLKGLDIIAVTDHNTVGNVEAVMRCASRKGIVVVPGMEIESREEVHLLCLFPSLDAAKAMEQNMMGAMPDMENRVDIFGDQLLIDEKDNIIESEKRMLLSAVNLSVEEVGHMVEELEGVCIPAHVDRDFYSILSNLGIIPEEFKACCLELSQHCTVENFLTLHPELSRYSFIRSSDAHYLWDILERESCIELEEASIPALFGFLKNNGTPSHSC